MSADDYLAARRELLDGAFEPSFIRSAVVPFGRELEHFEMSGIAVQLSLARYPELESVFRSYDEAWSDYRVDAAPQPGVRSVLPPAEAYGPENPALLRLDFAWLEPQIAIPIVFRLGTPSEWADLMPIAAGGKVVISADEAPFELEDIEIDARVGEWQMEPVFKAADEAGYIKL